MELNNTFYHLPSERAFENWRETVPSGFVFAIKASRLITHFHKLVNVEKMLHNFLARARLLGPKLGPVLFQLPPGLVRDNRRLEGFLGILPKGDRYVFEFRESSWFAKPVFDLLEKYGVGFCVSDLPTALSPVVATTDYAYFRFHGSHGDYSGSYSDEALNAWANKIRDLPSSVKIVYAYFNNDVDAAAIRDARRLRQRLQDRDPKP